MERSEKLKHDYNVFWCKVLDSKEDLYSKMSLRDYVELKKAISNINNIITFETTKAFIEFLKTNGVISAKQTINMHRLVENTNANANGYDIEYPNHRYKSDDIVYLDDERNLIAEVKCCIPVNKNSYGAAQEKSIITDIKGLTDGKNKSGIDKQELHHYLKFLVLLDSYNDVDSYKVKVSAIKIIEKANKSKGVKVKLYKPDEILDCSTVYVVILSID